MHAAYRHVQVLATRSQVAMWLLANQVINSLLFARATGMVIIFGVAGNDKAFLKPKTNCFETICDMLACGNERKVENGHPLTIQSLALL